MPTLLASLEDFASSRGQDYDPTDLQALIALEGASGAVRSYCGQTFDYVEDDEITVDGHGTRSLILPQIPVHEVTEVAIVAWDATETVLETTDYVLDGAAGILRRSGNYLLWAGWPWAYTWYGAEPRIRIVYSHGYILPEQAAVTDIPRLPAELSLVTMQIASRMFSMASQGGQMVRAESIGSYSVEYGSYATSAEESAPLDVERLVLDKYRVRTAV